MTSGPVFIQILKVRMLFRKSRLQVQPQEANPGTIRADFANSIDANAVHGSIH